VNPLKPVRAVLKDVKNENVDIKTYTLEVREGYTPGGARPGQFNMLGYPGIGEAPISFSALPENGELRHTIRAVGMATRFIEKLEKGVEVLVRGPYGRGWPMEAAQGKDLVLIAGGIGLAPIRPVIIEVMKRRQDFGKVFVLFGARNETGLIYTDEYKTWQQAGIAVEVTVDELVTKKPWKYNLGLITGLVDKLELNTEKTIAFVCGPELMMRFACRGLMLKGVPSSDLYVSLERRMKCGIAQCGHCQHVGLFVCKDGPVFSYSQVEGLYDGLL
jgi:NAD(P)H-flavin reductase